MSALFGKSKNYLVLKKHQLTRWLYNLYHEKYCTLSLKNTLFKIKNDIAYWITMCLKVH